jgi:HK97 gp10 family phage protein
MISARAVFTPRSEFGRFVEARVTPAVRASVEAACALIQETAKNYCPVDTGALQASITTEIDDSGKTIVGTVGPHRTYADYVEFGTYKMAAQPYMRPSFDENKPAILEIFKGQISSAIGS